MNSGLRLRQLAILVFDLEAAIEEVSKIFLVRPSYADPAIANFGMNHVVMPIGGSFLELLSPIEGVDSAGARYLARRGGDTVYMVILHAADAIFHRDRLKRSGVRVVHEVVREPNIAVHLHPGDAGGVLLDINGDTRTTDLLNEFAPWPHCGNEWQRFVNQEVITGLSAVDLESIEPDVQAETWCGLLDKPLTMSADSVPSIRLDEGEIRFVRSGRQGTGIAGFEVSTGDPRRLHSHLDSLGYEVSNNSFNALGCRIRIRDS